MQIKSLGRRHKSASEKSALLAAFARTGLTQAEFAAQQGLGLSTFQRWLRQSRRNGQAPSASLIEVPNLLAARASAAVYRLAFPGGVVLEVAPGFQATEVRALAQVIQGL
jgi:transposase-like protein